jgi:hypothetical protein
MRRIGTMALCCLMLIIATPWPGQAQGRHRGRFYTKADVERIIKRVEDRSDSFTRLVDRSLDRGVLDGTNVEDRINEHVKEFERALDSLRSEFDRHDRWQETRSHVNRVLDEAEDVNSIVRNRRLRPEIEREWTLLRVEINKLAGVYDLPRMKA